MKNSANIRPDDPRVVLIAAAIVALVPTSPAPVMADELVPLAKAGVDAGALRRLVRRGILPAARIGRSVYVRRSDLVALVDKLARRPKAAPAVADGPDAEYSALVSKSRGAR